MAALVALLPFAQGLLSGQSFYFRDLAGAFFPVRLFTLAGLLRSQATYWNPYTHEGEPIPLPLGYPLDLLPLLWPSESGLSLVLALHLPLAAIAFYALARHLGVSEVGAVGGASVYCLGGFALSSLNLYVHLQALAWAPLIVRGLLKAAGGDRRDAAWAAVPLCLALTTTGAEIVAQALGVGVCLAARRSSRVAGRMGLTLILGIGLASYVLLPVAAQVAASARGAGLTTDVVLSHSVHPITLIQTVVAGLYGDTSRFTESFWGQNFFPRGFPYFLSLYVGAAALALAALGATSHPRFGWRLAALGVAALIACLGVFIGLAPVVDAFPILRKFRFPSKAFFTVHFVAALLASLALDALAADGSRERWRRLSRIALPLFTLVAIVPYAASTHRGLYRFLVSGFFPADLAWRDRVTAAAYILRDAATGGFVVLAVAALAFLAARGRLRPRTTAALAAALVTGDLLRAGAGLNPMVPPFFFRLSAGAEQIAATVRESGQRLHVVDPGYSPAYFAARTARGRNHERWTFKVLQESFAPDFNLAPRVRTALTVDRTMLVPEDRILQPQSAQPAVLPQLLTRLRAGAVSHVVSIEPLDHPDLELVYENRSPGISPLVARLYRLRGAAPRIEILGTGRVVSLDEATDRIRLVVEAEADTTLVLRDAAAPGWAAHVDGREAPLWLHEGRYRAAGVPRGRHDVEFGYSPPGLRVGLALSCVSLALLAVLLRGRREQPSLGA